MCNNIKSIEKQGISDQIRILKKIHNVRIWRGSLVWTITDGDVQFKVQCVRVKCDPDFKLLWYFYYCEFGGMVKTIESSDNCLSNEMLTEQIGLFLAEEESKRQRRSDLICAQLNLLWQEQVCRSVHECLEQKVHHV